MDGYISKPLTMAQLDGIIAKVCPIHDEPVQRVHECTESHSGTWDPATALARLGNDETLMREIVEIFLAETPKHLMTLRQAIKEGNFELMERIAHSLKGEVRFLEIPLASQIAGEVEEMGRSRNLHNAMERVGRLEGAIEEVTVRMRSCGFGKSLAHRGHST